MENDYIFMTAVVYVALFVAWVVYMRSAVKKDRDNWWYDIAGVTVATAVVAFAFGTLVFTSGKAAAISMICGLSVGMLILLWSIRPFSKTKDSKEKDTA